MRSRHLPDTLAAHLVGPVLAGLLITPLVLTACDDAPERADADATIDATADVVAVSDADLASDAELDRGADPDVLADAAPDVAADPDASEEPDADAVPDADLVAQPDLFGVGCNGHVELCARRYDEVAYATTHNAMSNAQDRWLAPNQQRNMASQLADGVTAFMIDVYDYRDDVYLCHGYCEIGSRLYVEALTELREFLEAHPGRIFTIIIENYVDGADHEAALAASGLDELLYHYEGGEWPTLGEMVEADQRVVMMADDRFDPSLGILYMWDVAYETDWDNGSVEELDCSLRRGDPANDLFILNHFVHLPPPVSLPSPDIAEEVNVNPFFIDEARECEEATGSLPNFVTVDFYSIGDVFDVVDTLNGF